MGGGRRPRGRWALGGGRDAEGLSAEGGEGGAVRRRTGRHGPTSHPAPQRPRARTEPGLSPSRPPGPPEALLLRPPQVPGAAAQDGAGAGPGLGPRRRPPSPRPAEPALGGAEGRPGSRGEGAEGAAAGHRSPGPAPAARPRLRRPAAPGIARQPTASGLPAPVRPHQPSPPPRPASRLVPVVPSFRPRSHRDTVSQACPTKPQDTHLPSLTLPLSLVGLGLATPQTPQPSRPRPSPEVHFLTAPPPRSLFPSSAAPRTRVYSSPWYPLPHGTTPRSS